MNLGPFLIQLSWSASELELGDSGITTLLALAKHDNCSSYDEVHCCSDYRSNLPMQIKNIAGKYQQTSDLSPVRIKMTVMDMVKDNQLLTTKASYPIGSLSCMTALPAVRIRFMRVSHTHI